MKAVVALAESQQEALRSEGMPTSLLEDLKRQIGEFEAASEGARSGRRVHIGARVDLEVVAGELVELVGVLNARIRWLFWKDQDLMAEWNAAKHVPGLPRRERAPGRVFGGSMRRWTLKGSRRKRPPLGIPVGRACRVQELDEPDGDTIEFRCTRVAAHGGVRDLSGLSFDSRIGEGLKRWPLHQYKEMGRVYDKPDHYPGLWSILGFEAVGKCLGSLIGCSRNASKRKDQSGTEKG